MCGCIYFFDTLIHEIGPRLTGLFCTGNQISLEGLVFKFFFTCFITVNEDIDKFQCVITGSLYYQPDDKKVALEFHILLQFSTSFSVTYKYKFLN